jgi:HJR/Mrr/RecB family endonuclease
MDRDSKEQIYRNIALLESLPSSKIDREPERLMMEILVPLLCEDGYTTTKIFEARHAGFDFIAEKPANQFSGSCSIGIEQKHYHRDSSVGVDVVTQVLNSATPLGIDRVILVVNTQFTQAACELARREAPVRVELLDINALKAWASRIEENSEVNWSEVELILQDVSRAFAHLVAKDPVNLDRLEWRDLERMLAEVFYNLGFSVELTPGSKDGGKDIILECLVAGKRLTYIVEIKHWRCGNRVGQPVAKDFLNVIVKEHREGGLLLATHGYCDNAFEMLSEVERQRVRFGAKAKVVGLCRTYVKTRSGIWSVPAALPEVLFEDTF